jgi:hypothetical protein
VTEPIVIGGSQLQALILATVGAVIAVAARSQLVGPAGLAVVVLVVGAVAIAVRRCELHADRVVYRRLGRSIVAGPTPFRAEMGHRYLRITTAEGASFRIEVPVEIRPEVRDWTQSLPVSPSSPE